MPFASSPLRAVMSRLRGASLCAAAGRLLAVAVLATIVMTPADAVAPAALPTGPLLDLLLLIDFSHPPEQGNKDREIMKEAFGALLAALAQDKEIARLRIYPFAGSVNLTDEPLEDSQEPGFSFGRASERVERALAATAAEQKAYAHLEPRRTDLAAALRAASTFEADDKARADRARRGLFPATLVVSNGIHDPGPDNISCRLGPDGDSPHAKRFRDAVTGLKRRTVFVMTPCDDWLAHNPDVTISAFPFWSMWLDMNRHHDHGGFDQGGFIVVPIWDREMRTDHRDFKLKQNVGKAIRSLRPPVYFRPPTDPVKVQRAGPFRVDLQPVAPRPELVKLCLVAVDPDTTSEPANRIELGQHVYTAIDSEDHCTEVTVGPGVSPVIPMVFRPDPGASHTAVRPGASATIRLAVRRDHPGPPVEALIHPGVVQVPFRYDWPQSAKCVFSAWLKWLLAVWAVAGFFLFVSGLYRSWGIGSNRWTLRIVSSGGPGARPEEVQRVGPWFRRRHMIFTKDLVKMPEGTVEERGVANQPVLRLWLLGADHVAVIWPRNSPATHVTLSGYDRGREDKGKGERQVLHRDHCKIEDQRLRITLPPWGGVVNFGLTWTPSERPSWMRTCFSSSVRWAEWVKGVAFFVGVVYIGIGAFLVYDYQIDDQGFPFNSFWPCLSLFMTAAHVHGLWGAIRHGGELLEKLFHLNP